MRSAFKLVYIIISMWFIYVEYSIQNFCHYTTIHKLIPHPSIHQPMSGMRYKYEWRTPLRVFFLHFLIDVIHFPASLPSFTLMLVLLLLLCTHVGSIFLVLIYSFFSYSLPCISSVCFVNAHMLGLINPVITVPGKRVQNA